MRDLQGGSRAQSLVEYSGVGTEKHQITSPDILLLQGIVFEEMRSTAVILNLYRVALDLGLKNIIYLA